VFFIITLDLPISPLPLKAGKKSAVISQLSKIFWPFLLPIFLWECKGTCQFISIKIFPSYFENWFDFLYFLRDRLGTESGLQK